MRETTAIIRKILELEWEMFQEVRNIGGRADCQNDLETFQIMRESQFLALDELVLESYLQDLLRAKAGRVNLLAEKYLRMMQSTTPEEYEKEKYPLMPIDDVSKNTINAIVEIELNWMEDQAKRYPGISSRGRPVYSAQDTARQTSFETYLRGELATYSKETLLRYLRHIERIRDCGGNICIDILEYTAAAYGYSSLEEAEIRVARGV